MATHVNITMPVGDTFTHRGITWRVETNGITNTNPRPASGIYTGTATGWQNIGWATPDNPPTFSDKPSTETEVRAQAIRRAYSAAAQHNIDLFEPKDAITIAHYITTGHTP